MECGRKFPVKDYADEMSEELWEEISGRPANRA
jgi:hypothetical protein